MSQPFAQVALEGQFVQLAQVDDVSSSGGIDLDPPQVDHIPVVSGVAGSPQSFSVKAVDVQGISSVTLLYRANPEDEYKRVLMQQVSGTDDFSVSIDVSLEHRLIEYYFLVIDIGGNKVLNGFPYDPFSRTLTQPQAIIEDSTLTAPVESPQDLPQQVTSNVPAAPELPEAKEEVVNKKTLLWVALGVAVIGALIGVSSGGGGGGGGEQGSGSAEETEETVPVIVNVPLPE